MNLPLEQQAWFAGRIDQETATERIKALPVGTFLVRSRGIHHEFALDLRTQDGVKHLKVYRDRDGDEERFSFSPARSFPTLQGLIGHYRTNDLLENFSYSHMVGAKLKLPYKNA